jgi:hypothetical protein
MIEMKCPACGAGGRVPRDKVGARLVCKKCLKVFHLTPSGQTVLGEPPPPKVAPKEKKEKNVSKEPTGYEATAAIDALASKVAKVQLPSPRTLGIIAGIALVIGLGFWLFSRQSLEKRARIVGESFRNQGDIKRIVDISLPGTETDVILWFNDAYRDYLNVKLVLGREPSVDVQAPGASGGNTGVAIVRFSGRGPQSTAPPLAATMQPIPSLANVKDTLDLRLFFTVDSLGNWLLDGTRTKAEHEADTGRTP